MIALLPAYLTKAYVRGHLRTLADGRAIQVHPYHTKTAAASREDTRTRDIFADIPPAENQHRPRIPPARTTTPRKAVVPFQAVYPQLFDDKPLASEQNGHYNQDDKGRNPAPAAKGKKMDSKPNKPVPKMTDEEVGAAIQAMMAGGWTVTASDESAIHFKNAAGQTTSMTIGPAAETKAPNDAHHDPIHGYTDSVAQLEKDREQERRLRSELADAKRAEDEEWTPEVTEKRRAEWNDWLKAANGRKLSAKEIAEQEKKQGFTLDALKRHLARHGVDKRHVATKAALLKEMGKDLDAAKGTPIATDIKTVIDLIVSTDPENRPFQDTVKDKWSKGEKAAFERFKAWKAEKNATAAKEREAKATPEQAKPATSTPGRIYLSVPYADKDKAKATADKAGTRIRFDGDKKKWYWEGEGDLPGALARWK